MFHLVTPGDLAKDSFFVGAGFSPALLGHIETGLLFGFLTLGVNVVFRAVELYLKYGKKRAGSDGSASSSSSSPEV